MSTRTQQQVQGVSEPRSFSPVRSAPPIVHEVLRSEGQSVDPATRTFMESRFDRDFSAVPSTADSSHSRQSSLPIGASDDRVERAADDTARSVVRETESHARPAATRERGFDFSTVRVHRDDRAAESARSVNALAYTVGRDVVFARGQYAPDTRAGRYLLAHELAHVVQNSTQAGDGMLHRFESPEHQDFGDKGFEELTTFLATAEGKKWSEQYRLNPKAIAEIDQDPLSKGKKIKVGQLELSPGDVIALMGDFYRSPQALLKAPPREVAELLDAIRRERAGELGGGKANELYQEITARYRKKDDTYLMLAKNNTPHFTPGNRAEWKKMHLEAIQTARESRARPEALQEALLIDSAGSHFLTDAFASGHLFNKQGKLGPTPSAGLDEHILMYLQKNPPRPANPEMQGYYGLSNALDVMPQLVLKNVHDRLNREGIDVSNSKGMKWRAYGDDRLRNSPETLRIGALAVYMSRRQIMLASKQPDTTFDPDEVLDLLPDEASVNKTTERAISYIPAAAADISGLLYRQRGGAKAGLVSAMPPVIGPLVGAAIKSNLTTIANPGREKQLLETQERARETGMPQVAPQFTLLEF